MKNKPAVLPYGWLFLGSILFVAYGSLVPVRLQPIGLDEALSRIMDPSFLDFRAQSKTDWSANFLILVPTSYFAVGFFRTRLGFLTDSGATAAALITCVMCSLFIEFTQIFFPPRVASLSDVLAQTLGALCGIFLQRCLGARLENWVGTFRAESRPPLLARSVLLAYTCGYFLYELMPLDLTLSPVELFRKWKNGHVVLMPWTFTYASNADAFYQFATDMALWAPVCALFLLGSRLSRTAAVLYTVALATLLEIMQLFVLSRVTDTTDIVAAAVGAVTVAALWRHRPFMSAEGWSWSLISLLSLTGFVMWGIVVMWVFWYPFDFTKNTSDISRRLGEFFKVPLVTYFYRSELMGLTEILRRLLWFMPLGFFGFGMLLPVDRCRIPWLKWVFMIPLLAVIAFGVELAQVALPGKAADASDAFLGTIGAVIGSLGAARLFPLILRARARSGP